MLFFKVRLYRPQGGETLEKGCGRSNYLFVASRIKKFQTVNQHFSWHMENLVRQNYKGCVLSLWIK
jgi:hypothetical protein